MTRVTSAVLLPAAIVYVLPAWAAEDLPKDPVLEEVVITGSRVIKNGDASPTPLTVINTEDIVKVQPTTLADQLQLVPVFSGSRGQFSNPAATGGVGGGNGAAFVSMAPA